MSDEFDGTDDGIAEEVDDTPTWVNEGTEDDDIEIEGEDISQAEGGGNQDWVEPHKGVTFEITSATLNSYPEGPNWEKRSLKLYLRVDRAGIDGKGAYAGKMFFPNSFGNINGLLITVNRDSERDFTVTSQGKSSKFYEAGTGGAFADYKDFLLALGFPVNPTPKNTKAFRDALVGRKLVADITKKPREVYDKVTKQRVKIADEFENELTKFRPIKVAAVGEEADEAAA